MSQSCHCFCQQLTVCVSDDTVLPHVCKYYMATTYCDDTVLPPVRKYNMPTIYCDDTVLPPVCKYNTYTDILLRKLEDSGIGYHIGYIYVGRMGYGDDQKLLCPSIKGLQKMFNISSEFGIEYDICYNEKKTVCICYSRADKHMESFQIYLNGKVLKFETIVKHLGLQSKSSLRL